MEAENAASWHLIALNLVDLARKSVNFNYLINMRDAVRLVDASKYVVPYLGSLLKFNACIGY